jgi:hypothetical protein
VHASPYAYCALRIGWGGTRSRSCRVLTAETMAETVPTPMWRSILPAYSTIVSEYNVLVQCEPNGTTTIAARATSDEAHAQADGCLFMHHESWSACLSPRPLALQLLEPRRGSAGAAPAVPEPPCSPRDHWFIAAAPAVIREACQGDLMPPGSVLGPTPFQKRLIAFFNACYAFSPAIPRSLCLYLVFVLR